VTALLERARSFRHGVHPDDSKTATCDRAIERMPFVEEYVLPLSQHLGKPSLPAVGPGRRVERGELIAEADGFISTALHAPVTGTVSAVELRPHPSGKRQPAIVIQADPFASQRLVRTAGAIPEDASAETVVRRVQEAGLVGLGGAAFPSHVKLSVPPGKRVRFVMVNGCECEPYLTCDHRVMVESAEAVLRGLRLMMRVTGAERGYVGVESNKPDAIEALRSAAGDDASIEVVPLQVKYPQGAEKMLIDAVLRKEVPAGRLPLDLEIVVNNAATTAALADVFAEGRPLVERVVTIAGPGVRRPTNLLVPLGTPVRAVLDHCGGLLGETKQLIMGGPMMGQAQKTPDVPVLKGTSGLLAFVSPAPLVREDPCIRCGRCLEACPMFLNPSRLQLLTKAEEPEELKAHHVLDCFECASCSYVCPSHIPLVQLMRVGKALARSAK
jgi:electron transport complex protein RnfC